MAEVIPNVDMLTAIKLYSGRARVKILLNTWRVSFFAVSLPNSLLSLDPSNLLPKVVAVPAPLVVPENQCREHMGAGVLSRLNPVETEHLKLAAALDGKTRSRATVFIPKRRQQN